MTINQRTIDDLGIDASNDYANAKAGANLDPRLVELVQESAQIFTPTSQVASSLYLPPSEDELLFTIGKATTWGRFFPPPDDAYRSSRLFYQQMIPTIKNSGAVQDLLDIVEPMLTTLPPNSPEKSECENIITFLKHLFQGFKTFEVIKARCNQYQRG